MSGLLLIKETRNPWLNFQDIFNENLKLSKKLYSLEGKNICLQNIKRELIEQLGDARAATKTLEEEVSQLKEDFLKVKTEKEQLDYKMKNLEVKPLIYFNL